MFLLIVTSNTSWKASWPRHCVLSILTKLQNYELRNKNLQKINLQKISLFHLESHSKEDLSQKGETESC